MSANQLVAGQATELDDPTDLTRDDYVAALKRTFTEIKADDVPSLAAGVAFRIFLSLFPSLLAAVAIFSIVTTAAEMSQMLENSGAFLPRSALDLIRQPLDNLAEGGGAGAGVAAIGGIAAGLWAATSAAVAMMKALSRAYDTTEDRKFVKQRVIALALVLALVISLVGLVVLFVVGPQLQTALLPDLVAPFTWLLAIGRFVLALALLVVLFAFVYWVGPNRDQPRWIWMSPGALFGVLGWLLASGGFTLYAQTAGSYEATYGAVAGVAVLLIWLQLSILVILVGAEFNAEIERRRSLRRRVAHGAGFATPAVSGAAAAGSADAAEATLVEAATEAHTVAPGEEPAEGHRQDLPPTVLPRDIELTDQSSRSTRPAGAARKARKTGAVVAAVMAVVAFLRFARKRSRR